MTDEELIELAGNELKKQRKEEKRLTRRYNIKIALQLAAIAIIYLVLVVAFVNVLSRFNLSLTSMLIISLLAMLIFCLILVKISDFKRDQKRKRLDEEEAAKRKIPPEFDTEYTEITLKLYKMIYDLQRAKQALTVLDISYINKHGKTDLDKRKMLSILRDCEEKVAYYPSQIETLRQRRQEILTDVKTNYPSELFPLKPIFLDRKYNNIDIDPECHDNNTWQYK